MKRIGLLASAAFLALISTGSGLFAAENETGQLGNVHFATSCSEVAQRRFDRAIRYQHSFWYTAAKELFEESAKADPECGIAYWGIALSLLANPHGLIPQPNLAPGLEAIERAKRVGAKSERERDLIDALTLMYRDYDKLSHMQRIRAYLGAMEKVAAKYPEDDETQIFYAITLNTSASPADKTYAQQLKGAAILEPIWKRQPQHPGIAHYLIHLYDYPPIAEKGLVAAKRYAEIAPAAPHAQHMPSHIFTRVGYWQDSIRSNAAAVKAAGEAKDWGEQFHSRDYMTYAYLQLAKDSEAKAVVDDITAAPAPAPFARAAFFALATSPARYAIERGDWNAAAGLKVTQSAFGEAMAMSYFARALGAARAGKPDAAKADIAGLVEQRDRLSAEKNSYWAEQAGIQIQIANAFVLDVEGKTDEALKTLSAAADLEDKTEKSPVTPGPLAPARELYGEMLLAHGMANEALAAFEASKAKEPNRFHGYYGAARAAEKLGDKVKARENYEKLVALAEASSRPEVAAARKYLASN